MSYKALYRKYRPKSFSDVKGQDHIVETLKNVVINHKISHGYLFCGPRGVGKTSLAKIFANIINCYHLEDVTKLCENCLNNLNSNLDIIEMDAASNNGVDSIRELKEKIEHLPTKGNYKVYIIDEVHMLSKGAFNALLKTLEEPPAHAIFILATTDPQKIPPTIISRLQRFNFRRISTNTIVNQLTEILEKENIKFDSKVLYYIARLATGGMRDALSITEQANAYGNGEIKLKDVIYAFGITSNQQLISLANNLFRNLTEESIKEFTLLKESGIDPKEFVISFIDLFKDYIIYQKTNDKAFLDLLIDEEIQELTINYDFAQKAIEFLYKLNKELFYTDNYFQLIEIYLIKISEINKDNKSIKNLNNNGNIENMNFKENKNNQDTFEKVIATTQELVVQVNQNENNIEAIEDDILTGVFDSIDNEVIIDTRELGIQSEILNTKTTIIPAFEEKYKKIDKFESNYSKEELIKALYICDIQSRSNFDAYLQILIGDNLLNEYSDLARAFSEVKIKAAGNNFLVLTSDNLPILNYLSNIENKENVQNLLKQYFKTTVRLILCEKNWFKEIALSIKKEREMNPNKPKPQFDQFTNIEIEKELSPSKQLFDKLNF
ncbi:DNA-directed DNA polymerase [Mycoplasmopsis maculosa]|uniref:DNA polymerase III subunit gamma/tau n=1 Tax=Mycoplasmopsis maculosa TaxID=114885 RepID=A0A449B4R6_9BACT|nr:DNA polymerase III subunit gamma/tau [Mycoplasmopsis maculosa]VEU75582.1 DNA-directed DNA polymerase [Mycoplasmopsis maculosa]